jgi:hypothetical protein
MTLKAEWEWIVKLALIVRLKSLCKYLLEDTTFRDPEIEPGIGIGLKQNHSHLVRKLDRDSAVCIAVLRTGWSGERNSV